MNKKFSTLMVALMAACGISSASAQTATPYEEVDWEKVETGDFVYLRSSTGKNGLVAKGGQLDSTVLGTSDSTFVRLDSLAWQVTVTQETGSKAYSFQNRATKQPLSFDAKSGSVKLGGKISKWAYDDDKGLYAIGEKDSVWTVRAGEGFYGMDRANSKSDAEAINNPDAGIIQAFGITTSFNLTADDFNNYIKQFGFAEVTGRDDKSDVTDGEVNVLTDNNWKAMSIHATKADNTTPYFPDLRASGSGECDTLMFQKVGSAEHMNFLYVDTATIDKVKSMYLDVKNDSVFLRNSTSPKYKSGLDSLHMFVVEYFYATDSMSIKPVATPINLDSPNPNNASWWNGVGQENVKTGLSVETSTGVYGDLDRSEAVVALRSMSSLTVLVVDSVRAIKNTEVRHGITYANITSPNRSGNLKGNAEIAAKKVYFIKSLNDGDNKGKYVVANQIVNYLATGAEAKAFADKASAAQPSTQWVVNVVADKVYELKNREFPGITYMGAFNKVKDSEGNELAGVYAVGSDTIMLEDAKCESVGKDNLITFGTGKDAKSYATTGYGYYDPETLENISYKVASASPFMSDLFMWAKEDSTLALLEDANYFQLEAVGNGSKYGAEAEGVDNLYRYSYKLKTKKGEYVAKVGDKYVLTGVITTTTPASIFLLKEIGEAGTYMMIDTAAINSPNTTEIKWEDVMIATVNAQYGDVYPASLKDQKADLFTITPKETPSMLFSDPAHYNIYNNNDRLAMGANNLAVMAQPGNDLKADADKFVNDNFTLWFDTVNYKKDIEASYFISQGIKAAEGEEEAQAEEAAAERMYLTVAHKDTVANNKELYSLQNAPRLYFRTASRYGVDSLIVSNFDKKAGALAPDTVCAGVTEVTFNKATGTNQLPDIDNFKFRFEVIDGTENYFMKSMTGQYVVSINGLLVAKAESEENMIATLNAPDYATSNDEVAVSEVKVIAADGGVQIVGAAGKKVVISNILGQTVANTIITSDNATIAAPAGVVVVAVEGEEAVKAIVK